MRRLALGAAWSLAAALVSSQALAQPAATPPPGIGSTIIGLVEKACLPLIKGQDAKAVIQAAGLKRAGDDFVLRLTGVQRIVLSPPTPQNPTVCTMQVDYDAGQTQAVADTLGAWAMSQDPPIPVLNGGNGQSWSWALDNGQIQEGLVFNAHGKGPGKAYESGTVLFSRRGP